MYLKFVQTERQQQELGTAGMLPVAFTFAQPKKIQKLYGIFTNKRTTNIRKFYGKIMVNFPVNFHLMVH